MITKEEYANRRKRLFDKMQEDSVAILAAAPEYYRTYESFYKYRQDSHFYYLTGFKEPEAVAVFIKEKNKTDYILFNRGRDLEKEVWLGKRSGQKGALEDFGAGQSFPIGEVDSHLPALLKNRSCLYYVFGNNAAFDFKVNQWIENIRLGVRRGENPPREIGDLGYILSEMRLIKSAAEISLLEKAAEITARSLARAIKSCHSGLYEYELQAEFIYSAMREGALECSFPPIVAGGNNSCTLHYENNDCKIQNGRLVLMDVGCEYQYYAGDITRTFPANGKFTQEQKLIYELVLKAQLAGIEKLKPGCSWCDCQTAAIRVLTEGLVELDILEGDVASLISQKSYSRFYMHNFSHFMGLEGHEYAMYQVMGQWRLLEPGMVMSAEPGLYIPVNSEGVDKKWWGIGVRIEDTVLITQNGNRILTKDVPKTIEEIESLMQNSEINL